MKNVLLSISIILLTGCERIHTIQYNPPIKSTEWCYLQPCIEIGNVVLSQPTSSIFVLLLAIQTLLAGYFLHL